jgi:leucyl-tRNA synthetase
MELRNAIIDSQREANVSLESWNESVDSLLLLMAPIAPHLSEELWERRGHPYSVHEQLWPSWDPELAKEETVTLVVQVNGKVRDRIDVPADSDDDLLRETALTSEKVQNWLNGKKPRKVIVVRGKLVNIVV